MAFPMLRRLFISGICILSGCSLAAAGTSGVWLDVPFVKQRKDGCGAASIAMVMQYWQRQEGRNEDPDAEYSHIQNELLSPALHGIYAFDMERYLRQKGFATYVFLGDREVLAHHLDKGRPLIVAVKPGRNLPLHFVVVVGVDQADQFVLLNDPDQRKLLKEDLPRFEREWKAAGHWTLLAVPATNSH